MIKRIKTLYYKFFKSGTEYARFLGVKVGEKCHIASDAHFLSKSYLIVMLGVTIGKGSLVAAW